MIVSTRKLNGFPVDSVARYKILVKQPTFDETTFDNTYVTLYTKGKSKSQESAHK